MFKLIFTTKKKRLEFNIIQVRFNVMKGDEMKINED